MSKPKKIILLSMITLILLLVGYWLYAQQYRFYRGPISEHFDGTRFHNRYNLHRHRFWDSLKWRWTRDRKPWPDHIINKTYPKPPARVEGDRLNVTFIGHATVLLQTQGLNIVTDPVWSERASPVSFAGPKRVRDPGVSLADLPKIDVILVSHSHYDQLDLKTLHQLSQRDNPLILTGLGVDQQLKNIYPGMNAHALDWNESLKLSNQITVYFVPAQHWSKRSLFDMNKTLWGGFVLKMPGGNVYFAGDTGFGKGDIFKKEILPYGPVRLALLPIGAYEPRWFMKLYHMNPSDAVNAFKLLHARYALGIHFGTFQLTDEAVDAPEKDLEKALKKADISDQHFRVLDVGQSWVVPRNNSLRRSETPSLADLAIK